LAKKIQVKVYASQDESTNDLKLTVHGYKNCKDYSGSTTLSSAQVLSLRPSQVESSTAIHKPSHFAW